MTPATIALRAAWLIAWCGLVAFIVVTGF